MKVDNFDTHMHYHTNHTKHTHLITHRFALDRQTWGLWSVTSGTSGTSGTGKETKGRGATRRGAAKRRAWDISTALHSAPHISTNLNQSQRISTNLNQSPVQSGQSGQTFRLRIWIFLVPENIGRKSATNDYIHRK